MRFTAGEVARATGGTLVGPEVTVDGVAFDSRSIEPGQLFVPLVGDGRDGHDFVDPSMTAYLTAREPVGGTAVVVTDTGIALADLGRHARSRLPARVIGITGSVGKTTVKDLTASVLARPFRTSASERSFNNELGVPVTLANARDDAQAVVIEMGARGIGHIRHLCEIARPTIGVVTAVGMVHTEVFGSIDDVARGKGELVEALPADGTAVLSADDERVIAMRSRTAARVLTFAMHHEADVIATEVHLDEQLRASFRLQSPWGDAEVLLSVRGAHHVGNALAAASAALAAGASIDDVGAGLRTAVVSPWRMEVHHSRSHVLVINDAYNANPLSVSAALHSLARVDATRRVAFLGTMAELGPDAPALHAEMAALAAELGIRAVAVDEPMYGVETVPSVDAALELARSLGLTDGDAVLVKGSRVAGLEHLAHALFDL